MGKLSKFFGVLFVVLFLSGCASLGEIAQDIQEIDATPEIGAVATLTGDIVDAPWDNIVQVAIGYALALLRRKYKVSKGAK